MTVGASVTAPVVGDAPRLRLIRLRVELCGSSAGFESARVPARDLDGDGIVTADYAIVLGDWSGAVPCDLHNSFPCNSTDSVAAARGTGGSYDDALAAMGWTSVQEFAAWGAQAPIAQLTAIAEEILAMVNSQNGGGE